MQIYKINKNGIFVPHADAFDLVTQSFHPTREGTHKIYNCVLTQSDYGFYNVTEFQSYNVEILLQAISLKAIA